MNEIDQQIGHKLKAKRKKLGITQAYLSKKLSISPTYLNLISLGIILSNTFDTGLNIFLKNPIFYLYYIVEKQVRKTCIYAIVPQFTRVFVSSQLTYILLDPPRGGISAIFISTSLLI